MKPLSEEEIAEGWKLHDGGECPVDGPLEVRVRTVSDDGAIRGESTLSKPANEWDWSTTAYWRIFNYREVTAEESLENFQNRVSRNIWESAQVVDDKALKAAVHAGVDKLGDSEPVTYHAIMGQTYAVTLRKGDTISFAEPRNSTDTIRLIDTGDDKPTATEAFMVIDNVETGAALQGGVVEAGESFFGAEQDKAMGDDEPAKDLRQLGRFSHHGTAFTTHVFYDEHPIAMITDDVISWSYHMPDMKKAAVEAMHVYLGRVWK